MHKYSRLACRVRWKDKWLLTKLWLPWYYLNLHLAKIYWQSSDRIFHMIASIHFSTQNTESLNIVNDHFLKAEFLLLSLERASGGIGLRVNAGKTYIFFNQRGDISPLKDDSLKLVQKFIYLGSWVSSTTNDINTWPAKTWTAIDSLSVI